MGVQARALANHVDALEEIAKIATDLTGVQLNQKHHAMIRSRLKSRLDELGLADFDGYLAYVIKNYQSESKHLISTLTTHHTYFFRESSHFDFLTEKALTQIIANVKKRGDNTIRVWSAASSRGQEVYSLAMALSYRLKRLAPEIKLDLLGTDIDPESIKVSKNGVYSWNEVKEIPLQYLSENWARGTGDIKDYAKVKAHLKAICRFEAQNLFKLNLREAHKFDIIFCRNVFIYFEPQQIKQITQELFKNLDPNGLLFLGISESLHGLNLPAKVLGPSIYANPESTWFKKVEAKSKTASEKVVVADKPIRVMVVDDSPSIHSLMKVIFGSDSGFEIVANAMNGLEAAAMLKDRQVDVVTLDIHMPEQDGVEYLRTNFNSKHPPVVMVSSVSREDSSLASQALDIGAADYVEKPAMNNLKERADELKTKLRCAYLSRKMESGPRDLGLNRSFEKSITLTEPEKKRRVLFLQGSDRGRVRNLINQFSASQQPPLAIVLDAGLQGAELVKAQLEKDLGRRFRTEEDFKRDGALKGEVYFFSLSDQLPSLLSAFQASHRTSYLMLGDVSSKMAGLIRPLKSSGMKLLLEELGGMNAKHSLKDMAYEYSPLSGFQYLSDAELCRT